MNDSRIKEEHTTAEKKAEAHRTIRSNSCEKARSYTYHQTDALPADILEGINAVGHAYLDPKGMGP